MAYIGQKPGSNFRNVTLKDSFTGDGSTTAFDLSKSFNQAGQNDLEVFVDNVRQEPTTAYTVGQDGSGNFKRVTFTAAPAASASIYILNQGETSGVLSVSDASVTSAKLNADAITGQTELAEAANNSDTVLLHDTSASALKKIQVSNLTAQAGDGLAKSSSTLSVDIANTTLLDEGAATGDFLLVYDSSAGALRRISQTNLLNFPTVSSVSPTNLTSGDGTGNYTFVITGTGFIGATASLINASGSTVNFDSQTVDSATQITGVIAKSSLSGSGEPYDVRVSAATGLQSTLENQINIDAQPVFSTAAGSLGTTSDSGRSGFSAITIFASDPESGGDVTYTLESGSLPAGLSGSSTSSGYVISGTPSAVGSNTTSNFTIRAKDAASNTSDRAYSLSILAPVYQSFTSSGTFSVPSGTTTVNVLVVAGGGGGGSEHGSTGVGGGGAGGLIFRPAFPVTPGGTVTVTVGDGGAGVPSSTSGQGGSGQDSVFGTLTAKGGGGGAGATPYNALSGGSGGGGAAPCGNGGTATQPTQSGDSGNYGFGNPGGQGGTPGGGLYGGGGGGGGAGLAGGQGGPAPVHGDGGNGGNGRAYTIADGSTPVYYAGGGGGSAAQHSSSEGSGGQGGGTAGNKSGPTNPGTANRGGGAGATRSANASGAGGKGIVIVQY